jgi:hypothetical protein
VLVLGGRAGRLKSIDLFGAAFAARGYAALALEYAQQAIVIENGKVAREGAASELREHDGVGALYLGGEGGAASGRHRPRRPEFSLGS